MNQNNRSYFDNNMSPDNTFNFGNELDISNGKKDRTGEMFFKQAYDFDDFQNIGDDKTVKSSNYKTRKNNTSNILKRQEQFSSKMIGNSVLNEFQLSGTGFNTKKVLDQSINKALSQKGKHPEFGERKVSVEQNKKYGQYSNANQVSVEGEKVNMRGSQLSYTKNNIEAQDPPTLQKTMSKIGIERPDDLRVKYEDYAQSFRKKEMVDFKKKQIPNFKEEQLLTKQEEYKQLVGMITFYKGEAERINYERAVMEEQSIGEMMNLCNSQGLEEQIKNHMEEINQLNREIEQQRAAQKKLTRVIAQLTEEYNQIVDSVEEMDFQRPPIIKDQAKVLMDEINQLKREFKDLQIDNGELNLSCTIPQIGTLQSIQNRMGQSHHRNRQQVNHEEQQIQQSINILLDEIHEENLHSQDSQFLKNLKMCCLKDEWGIFSNKEIMVSLDYKSCPLIKMRIGNKTNQQLQKFTMQIQVQDITVNYMQNQTINKKAFLLEGIKVDPQNFVDLFIRINISYQISQVTPEVKSIRLYCPVGLLNFGEFTPLTLKEFETQMTLPLPTLESPLKPIDKSFVNSIQEIMLYIPNLKPVSGQTDTIFGLFMSVFNEGTLVLMEQHLDLVKIKMKNGNKALLKLLQFILTV